MYDFEGLFGDISVEEMARHEFDTVNALGAHQLGCQQGLDEDADCEDVLDDFDNNRDAEHELDGDMIEALFNEQDGVYQNSEVPVPVPVSEPTQDNANSFTSSPRYCSSSLSYTSTLPAAPAASTPARTEKEQAPIIDREDLQKFQTETLQKLQTQIQAKTQKAEKLREKANSHKNEAARRRAEYVREWERKEKGEFALDQILASERFFQTQAQKRKDDFNKVDADIRELKKQVEDISADPTSAYLKTKRPTQKRKLRSRYTAQNPDPEFDSLEGDDSLSDNVEFKKMKEREVEKGSNSRIACRRCRFIKRGCHVAANKSRCAECITAKKKCRFSDPLFPGWSLPKGYLSDLDDEYRYTKARLEEYDSASKFSVWSSNPLSGITGYGPRPPRVAKQNYYLMARGKEPIYGQPTPRDKKFHLMKKGRVMKLERKPKAHRKQKQGEDTKDNTASSERQSITSETPQPNKRPADTIEDDISLTKRQRLASSTDVSNQRRTSSSSVLSSPILPSAQHDNNHIPTSTEPLPQTHCVGLNRIQLQYARTLNKNRLALPLDSNHLPRWPAWTVNIQDLPRERAEWLLGLASSDAEIPLTATHSPVWPSH